METRKIKIAAVLIILIVAFSVIPFNNKRVIIVKAQLYEVQKQINDLNNWKNWNPDIKDKDVHVERVSNQNQTAVIDSDYTYLLHHVNAVSVELTRKLNGKSTSSEIKISPVTDSTTNVTWREKISVYDMMKRNLTMHYSRDINLSCLKNSLED